MAALKKIIILFLFFYTPAASAQSSFKRLSCPEKKWVLLHPFRALKARHVTREVLAVVDSVKKSELIGTDNNGGQLDAFKHAYWMGRLAQTIGEKNARKLGIAHEKGNYLEFKNHTVEDAILPDSVSSEMDLRNNEIGINKGMSLKSLPPEELKRALMVMDADGFLYTIKKDSRGNFATCDGNTISMKMWAGKWNIPKCLVISTKH